MLSHRTSIQHLDECRIERPNRPFANIAGFSNKISRYFLVSFVCEYIKEFTKEYSKLLKNKEISLSFINYLPNIAIWWFLFG
jgi:hypothetical protein